MRRHPKAQNQSPLLLILIMASIFFVGITSSVSAHGIYQEYDTEGLSQPAAAVLMQGLSHHVYPWDALRRDSGPSQLAALSHKLSAVHPADITSGPGTAPDSGRADDSSDPAPDPSGNASAPGAPEGSSDLAADPASSPDIHETSDSSDAKAGMSPDGQPAAPGPQEPVQYEFTQVGQDYFDDAAVIGDSRAVGIQLYSGWDNITYYAESGMTVYNLFTRSITLEDGTETTIEEALKEKTFGKIYLEIGINEMGIGTLDSFMETYENTVQRLRELQPEADLFLCGIMYVRQSRSDSDPVFNNPGIRERNERIAALADQNSIFYLDINEVTSDATGNLNPDYTWDEVHLLGRYNVLWTEYLSSHGIVKTAEGENTPQSAGSPNKMS